MRVFSKIKAFFYVMTKSIISATYYIDVIKEPYGFSLKYFAILAICGSILVASVRGIGIVPLVYKYTDYLFEASETIYPEDLVISIEDGEISINQPEPYKIPMPDTTKLNINYTLPANLVVIDSDGTVTDFDKHDTLIIVNDINILTIYQAAENYTGATEIRAYPLKDIPNGTLTKEKYDMSLAEIKKISSVLPFIISALILLLMMAFTLMHFFIYRAIYLLIMGMLFMIIGKIKALELNYAQYYQIALHAMTLPFLVEVLTFIIETPLRLPMWFFVLNFVIGLIAVFQIAQDHIETKPATNTTNGDEGKNGDGEKVDL